MVGLNVGSGDVIGSGSGSKDSEVDLVTALPEQTAAAIEAYQNEREQRLHNFDSLLTGGVDSFSVTLLLRACRSPRAGNKYVNMPYNRDSAQKAYAEFLGPITPQVEAYKELDREGMISRDRAARILLNMHRWTLTEEQMEGDNPGFLSPTADKASDVLKELWRLCESTLGVTVRKSTTPDDINIVHAIDYFVGRILSVTDIEGRANALLYVIDNMQNEENSAQVEFLQDVLGLMVVR